MRGMADITQELLAQKFEIMELYDRANIKKYILNIWSAIYRNIGYHLGNFKKNYLKRNEQVF